MGQFAYVAVNALRPAIYPSDAITTVRDAERPNDTLVSLGIQSFLKKLRGCAVISDNHVNATRSSLAPQVMGAETFSVLS